MRIMGQPLWAQMTAHQITSKWAKDQLDNSKGIGATCNEDPRRDPRDVEEIARLQQRVRDLELQQHIRSEEETDTDPLIWEDGPGDQPPFDQDNPFARREPRPPGPRDDPLRSLGFKIDIPEFDGKAEPDMFIDWLQTVERFFDLREVPDAFKVKLVAVKLRKYASLWWEHVKKKRAQEGKSKESFVEYHNVAQRSTSVEELICEFDRLRMRCGAEEEEEHIIARFLGALRPEISDIVQLQPYWTFNDVCQLALKVEKQLRNKSRPLPPRISSARADSSKPSAGPSTNSRPQSAKPDGPPHLPNPPTSARGPPRCFKCGGLGHFARECPNTQLVTLVGESPAVYDTEVEEPQEEETETVYPNKGEALVIQRALSTNPVPPSEDNLWLRHNIFRTKCTIKGKICTIIIDGEHKFFPATTSRAYFQP
ncbi:hypothetical protein E3N88_32270 [Mikania micrantha]|uniref:CCHC-type domain-containing protein n=1 Tax=Mikania micrantha TaxID=192012 RepID=A0A5N6M997_9ASTR|nr:hypothetical protein E3N88_32270 [Mikania micrantha]